MNKFFKIESNYGCIDIDKMNTLIKKYNMNNCQLKFINDEFYVVNFNINDDSEFCDLLNIVENYEMTTDELIDNELIYDESLTKTIVNDNIYQFKLYDEIYQYFI